MYTRIQQVIVIEKLTLEIWACVQVVMCQPFSLCPGEGPEAMPLALILSRLRPFRSLAKWPVYTCLIKEELPTLVLRFSRGS
ncbi:hypothetical protein J6590_007343 [Homalodisca vitripennis]|nr:hypothetical protein J6590_007343 [Homalodisca vitripennis]